MRDVVRRSVISERKRPRYQKQNFWNNGTWIWEERETEIWRALCFIERENKENTVTVNMRFYFVYDPTTIRLSEIRTVF